MSNIDNVPEPRPTRRVRAYVVINDLGEVGIAGGSQHSEQTAIDAAVEDLPNGRAEYIYCIEAELAMPLPEPVITVRPDVVRVIA